MKKNQHIALALFILAFSAVSCEKEYSLQVLVTNDVHGTAFSKDFVEQKKILSMSNISHCVDSIRKAVGPKNVLLVDCGDHLQGTNTTYYSNFVDTSGRENIFSSIFNYMKYDALVLGNHDVEAGPRGYDRIRNESRCPYLAANVFRTADSSYYFDPYTVIRRGGLKVAVVGFTNANVKSWVSPDRYPGLDFCPIYPLAQKLVDEVIAKEHPHLVLLAVHSGLGDVRSDDIENNALFLAANVKGVDAVLASHDHKIIAEMIPNGDGEVAIVEGSCRSKALSKLDISLKVKGGKVLSKTIVPSVIDMKNMPSDPDYDREFEEYYELVRQFSVRTIGELKSDLDLSYQADRPTPYMSFIHYVQLNQPGVDISINAPLTSHGMMKKGPIIYNDLFTLYRFENLLYVVEMTGREVKDFLEAAYHKRITGEDFVFNYDTAAGIDYTVSRSAKKGRRVHILSMADGSAFDLKKVYHVALTSYRASGAGNLLAEAGIDPATIPSRLVKVHPEIRNLIYDFILAQKTVDPEEIASNKCLGSWKFIK